MGLLCLPHHLYLWHLEGGWLQGTGVLLSPKGLPSIPEVVSKESRGMVVVEEEGGESHWGWKGRWAGSGTPVHSHWTVAIELSAVL